MPPDNLYFGNMFNDQGEMWTAAPTDYLTSLIGNKSVEWLSTVAKGDQPFYAYIAPHAPHVPASVAPWYEQAPIPSEIAPRTQNW